MSHSGASLVISCSVLRQSNLLEQVLICPRPWEQIGYLENNTLGVCYFHCITNDYLQSALLLPPDDVSHKRHNNRSNGLKGPHD